MLTAVMRDNKFTEKKDYSKLVEYVEFGKEENFGDAHELIVLNDINIYFSLGREK